jgi:hypothetical protein
MRRLGRWTISVCIPANLAPGRCRARRWWVLLVVRRLLGPPVCFCLSSGSKIALAMGRWTRRSTDQESVSASIGRCLGIALCWCLCRVRG